MNEVFVSELLFLIAVFAFVLSIHSFRGKGILLNNAYLYATEQERKSMDKTPYYRQSAIVFLLIGCIFTLNGFSVLLHVKGFSYAAAAVAVGTVVYAIISTVVIEKKQK